MTPLPGALGGRELVGWRLDHADFAPGWDGGEGAFRVGGRWNSPGVRVVYAGLDPAVAILEVAVHKGFVTLDAVPHVLTSFLVADPAAVHVVQPDDVPDPDWLRPGAPGAARQAFGDALVGAHAFVALPSVASTRSWNLIFDPAKAGGAYSLRTQERFALDPRLSPATP